MISVFGDGVLMPDFMTEWWFFCLAPIVLLALIVIPAFAAVMFFSKRQKDRKENE
jgi:hypothetical protein